MAGQANKRREQNKTKDFPRSLGLALGTTATLIPAGVLGLVDPVPRQQRVQLTAGGSAPINVSTQTAERGAPPASLFSHRAAPTSVTQETEPAAILMHARRLRTKRYGCRGVVNGRENSATAAASTGGRPNTSDDRSVPGRGGGGDTEERVICTHRYAVLHGDDDGYPSCGVREAFPGTRSTR